MGKITDTVQTVNSAIRTLMILVVTGVLGIAGFMTYDKVTHDERVLAESEHALKAAKSQLANQSKEIDTLTTQVASQREEIDRLETSLRLLKVDHRLARLEVLEQTEPEGEEGRVQTTVRFTELSPDGDPVGEGRQFTVEGDVIYLDHWVVKFDDEFVQEADIARGTSLVLFRRVFGEYQTPSDGFAVDAVGSQPQAYASGGHVSEFEQNIWDRFWTFANDRELAQQQGIRAAHGEAVSIKTEEGQSYKILLRASDGISIVPETEGESS